jgi:hypothetical protein
VPDAQYERTESATAAQLGDFRGERAAEAAKAYRRKEGKTAGAAEVVVEAEAAMEVEVGPGKGDDETTEESHPGGGDHDAVHGDVHGDVHAYANAYDLLRGHVGPPSGRLHPPVG